MPEGDSVYLLAARLRSAFDGRAVESGELRGGAAAGTRLAGLRITGHETHGKHLLTRFDDELTLHTHLRMQGSWTVTSAGKTLPSARAAEARVRLRTDEGRTAWGLSLPVVELIARRDESRVLSHLGPDPLRDDWNEAEAERRLRDAAERPLIAALLDQRVIAGPGNLWANELCFLSGSFPWAPVGSVDLLRLVRRIRRVLVASATVPGMLQVTTGDRRRGRQHWVAGRAHRPCLRCGTSVRVRAEVPGDPERRRTWWCPHCQPE